MLNKILDMATCHDGTSDLVQKVLEKLTIEEVEWISRNRDWAEAARYELRDEVDGHLAVSPEVTSRRNLIEKIFQSPSQKVPELRYLELLQADWAALHSFLRNVLLHELTGGWSPDMITTTWGDFVRLADIDNAHAMYLSSGNWKFSVFNRLTDWIQTLGTDQDAMEALLMGGITDVRTSVYGSDILDKLRQADGRRQFAVLVKGLPLLSMQMG